MRQLKILILRIRISFIKKFGSKFPCADLFVLRHRINLLRTNKTNGVLPCVIGRVYGQTITGTTFKYEVLEHKGEFHGKQYYIVRNIETEHRMLICESELHVL